MCGRFTLLFTWDEIRAHLSMFLSDVRENVGPEISAQPKRYNIAPTQPVVTIRLERGSHHVQLMRWGFVPHWVKDPREFPLIINARAETMGEKASFKNALKNQRCIVPATGYYEWRKNDDGTKTCHYITLKDDRPVWLAGLYSNWSGPNGEEIDTVAIVTIAAEGEMKTLHDRTPAILNEHQATDWLNTADISGATANKLIAQLKIPETKFHAVTARVGSVRNDDEDLILPVYENAPGDAEQETESQSGNKSGGQLDLF